MTLCAYLPIPIQQQASHHIVALLKARGQGQRQLATHLGKTQSWISMILTGRRRVTLATMAQIASFFGIALGLLVGEHAEGAPMIDDRDPCPLCGSKLGIVPYTADGKVEVSKAVERLTRNLIQIGQISAYDHAVELIQTAYEQLVVDLTEARERPPSIDLPTMIVKDE